MFSSQMMARRSKALPLTKLTGLLDLAVAWAARTALVAVAVYWSEAETAAAETDEAAARRTAAEVYIIVKEEEG